MRVELGIHKSPLDELSQIGKEERANGLTRSSIGQKANTTWKSMLRVQWALFIMFSSTRQQKLSPPSGWPSCRLSSRTQYVVQQLFFACCSSQSTHFYRHSASSHITEIPLVVYGHKHQQKTAHFFSPLFSFRATLRCCVD